MLTRAGNDSRQVEPVRRTAASVVLFESGSTPLDEPDRPDAVTAGGMREADTDLGKTPPQVAFFARTSLPPRTSTVKIHGRCSLSIHAVAELDSEG